MDRIEQDPPNGGAVYVPLRPKGVPFSEVSDEVLAHNLGLVARSQQDPILAAVAEEIRGGVPGARNYAHHLMREALGVSKYQARLNAQQAQQTYFDYLNSREPRATSTDAIPPRRDACPQPVAAHDCEAGRSRQSRPRPTAKRTTSSGRSPDDPAPGPSDPPAVPNGRDLLRQLLKLATDTLLRSLRRCSRCQWPMIRLANGRWACGNGQCEGER